MKEFHIHKGTQIKAKENSKTILHHLLIALLPIILFSWYKNGILPFVNGDTDLFGMLYPILFVGLGTLTTYLIEVIYAFLLKKKKGIEAFSYSWNSYSIFVGLFLGLILPINTPIPLLLLGSVVASVIGKLLFGGFGHNIFNPALIGFLFVTLLYGSLISSKGGYLNPTEIDTLSTATPLSNIATVSGLGTYKTLVKPYGSLWNFFLGTIPGAMGETSALLCLFAYIYLSIKKVIKWKIPLTYVLTVFALTFMVGNYHDLGIWYPVFQILSGGLMFGAVFMATDPVTSPTTPIGQILYGMFLGILTVTFRYLTPFPEGVMFSILIMNLFVFLLDKIGSKARFDFGKALVPFFVAWIVMLSLGVYLGMNSTTTDDQDVNYKIISKVIKDNRVTYIATQKGYSSTLKAEIVIEDGDILSYKMLEQDDSFYSKVEQADYLNQLVQNQKKLENYDTVSGATISSTAVKKLLMNTLEDYKKQNKEEIIPEEPQVVEKEFEVLEVIKEDASTIYLVTQKSFGGKIKAEITFDQKGSVSKIHILECYDSYKEKVLEGDYLETLIQYQNTLPDVDTISGATITSTSIKKMLEATIQVYGEQNEE